MMLKRKSIRERFNQWLEEIFSKGREFKPETIEELEEIALRERIYSKVERGEESGLLRIAASARREAEELRQMLNSAKSKKELNLRAWVEGKNA